MAARQKDYIFTDVGFADQRRARADAIARLGLAITLVQSLAGAAKEYFDGLMAFLAVDVAVVVLSGLLLWFLRLGWSRLVRHAGYWLILTNVWLIVLMADGIGAGARSITLWWFGVLALASHLMFFDSRRPVVFGYVLVCSASFLLCLFSPVPVAALAPPPEEFFESAGPIVFTLQLVTMLAIIHTFTRDISEAELQLASANSRLGALLENMLPVSVAKRLRDEGHGFAEGYAEVSVLFADIVGFTELATNMPPKELVALLDRIFSRFDDITESLGLEKIKTMGDAYMVASGVPIVRKDHAQVIARLALGLRASMAEFPQLRLRIGINSGAVVAGVIGKKRFIYDIWGDAVNLAYRMQAQGLADQIQTTEATYSLLKGQFDFEHRGPIEVRGKGLMMTYLLKDASGEGIAEAAGGRV